MHPCRIVATWLTLFLFLAGASAQEPEVEGHASRPETETGDAAATTQPAATQPAEAPAFFRLDYSGDWATRPALTGDWGGVRNTLAENGFSFEYRIEQTIQSNMHGGRDTNSAFRYSGSHDMELKFDTGRLGLWPGGLLDLHAESQWGESISGKVGASVNDDMLFPLPGYRDVVLSHVMYTQFLSEHAAVFVGKLDTTLGDENEFAWTRTKDNFLNSNLRWNPIVARTVPYSTLGAGFMLFDMGSFKWSFMIFDSEGVPNESGCETVFDGGTTLATEARVHVKPFGLPGHQLLGLTWSDRNFLSTDQDPRLILPDDQFEPTVASSSFAVYYNFDQYLYVEDEATKQGVGLFGRFGISDGDANPINTFYSIGVGGKGIVPGRDDDKFGLGYYFTDFSDFPDRVGIHSTQGVELFYNIQVTPWFTLTPDFQVIVDPGGGAGDHDVALVAGLRAMLVF